MPDPLRKYIHDLETRCDPAGDVARMTLLKDQNRQLQMRGEQLEVERDQLEGLVTYLEESASPAQREAWSGIL